MGNLWQSILDARWLWSVLPLLLLVSAVLVVAWALFRDRPGLWGVPRERCPRCRYDMAGRAATGDGSGPIVCPECGRTIKETRALTRTRRRWGMALLAAPLLVGWHLAAHKERIRWYGWPRAVPDVVYFAVVDQEAWLRASVNDRSARHRSPPWLLDEFDHRLHVAPDWMTDRWFRGVPDSLRDRGIVVYDLSDVWEYQIHWVDPSKGGNTRAWMRWGDTDPAFGMNELLELLDELQPMGRYWEYGDPDAEVIAFTARDRLVVRAPEPFHANAAATVDFVREVSVKPTVSRSLNVNGWHVFLFDPLADQPGLLPSYFEEDQQGYRDVNFADAWGIPIELDLESRMEIAQQDVLAQIEYVLMRSLPAGARVDERGGALTGSKIIGDLIAVYSREDRGNELRRVYDEVLEHGLRALMDRDGELRPDLRP